MDDCAMQTCLLVLLIIMLIMHFRKSQGHQGLIEGWTQRHKDNLFLLLSDSSGNIERYAMKDLINTINTKHSDTQTYAERKAREFSDDRLTHAKTYTNSEISKAKTFATSAATTAKNDAASERDDKLKKYVKKDEPFGLFLKKDNHRVGGGGHKQIKWKDYSRHIQDCDLFYIK